MPCRDRRWERAMRGWAGSPAGARGVFCVGRGGGPGLGLACARDVFMSASRRVHEELDRPCACEGCFMFGVTKGPSQSLYI
jgi:hypothetical protein